MLNEDVFTYPQAQCERSNADLPRTYGAEGRAVTLIDIHSVALQMFRKAGDGSELPAKEDQWL